MQRSAEAWRLVTRNGKSRPIPGFIAASGAPSGHPDDDSSSSSDDPHRSPDARTNGSFDQHGNHYGSSDNNGARNNGPSGGSHDPPWDSHDRRSRFRLPMTPAALRRQHQLPERITGTHWSEFTQDPEHPVLISNQDHCPGWYASRGEYGVHCINFPVQALSLLNDKDFHRSNFHTGTVWNSSVMTHQFLKGFPTFPDKHAAVETFFTYYRTLLHYCLGYGVYIPPPQTLSSFALHGGWFSELPDHVKTATLAEIPTLLATGLSSKYNHLAVHKKIGPVLKASADGFVMLKNCMIIAGHPRFDVTQLSPIVPRQAADTTIAEYALAWQYCIYIR